MTDRHHERPHVTINIHIGHDSLEVEGDLEVGELQPLLVTFLAAGAGGGLSPSDVRELNQELTGIAERLEGLATPAADDPPSTNEEGTDGE